MGSFASVKEGIGLRMALQSHLQSIIKRKWSYLNSYVSQWLPTPINTRRLRKRSVLLKADYK